MDNCDLFQTKVPVASVCGPFTVKVKVNIEAVALYLRLLNLYPNAFRDDPRANHPGAPDACHSIVSLFRIFPPVKASSLY